MRSVLSKCETMAMHQGRRIHLRKDMRYELLSYDCKTIYAVGTIDQIYETLIEKAKEGLNK